MASDGNVLEWKTGEPPTMGWYDCLLIKPDGTEEEMRLRFWICIANNRKRHWIDEHGAYRDLDGEVRYFGTASTSAW